MPGGRCQADDIVPASPAAVQRPSRLPWDGMGWGIFLALVMPVYCKHYMYVRRGVQRLT